jgi:hypothetical protein
MRVRRIIVLLVAFGIVVTAAVLGVRWLRREHPVTTLTGAVIAQAIDPSRRVPISGVHIRVGNGAVTEGTESNSSGLFHLKLPPAITPGQSVTLTFTHPDYQPLIISKPAGPELYVVQMTPSPHRPASASNMPRVNVSNVTIRYTVRNVNAVSIGTAVRELEVVNKGHVTCTHGSTCSPDGRWQATVASVTLDAGTDNEFQNASLSCIAGPCPFTKIDSQQLSPDRRIFKVAVRDWSDTATYLIKAEVFRSMSEDVVSHLYPVIFEDEMDFTLPGEAEGPGIGAEVNGDSILFPLGPDLCLTWASCQVRVEQDQRHVYHCRLNPGYRFH